MLAEHAGVVIMSVTSSRTSASNEDIMMFVVAHVITDYDKLYSLHPVMNTKQGYVFYCLGSVA